MLQKILQNTKVLIRKVHLSETLNIFISDTILESIDRKEVTALVLLAL